MIRTRFMGTAGLLLGLALVGALFLTAYQSASIDPARADIPIAEAKSVSSLFDDPQTAQDTLPSFLREGPQSLGELALQTTRSLGVDRNVKYWTALNDAGEICLVALIPGPDQVAAMTCQPVAIIKKSGLGLQFADRTVALRAYFLPEGFTIADTVYTKVGNQLAVMDAGVATNGDPIASSVSGSIELMPFEALNFTPIEKMGLGR